MFVAKGTVLETGTLQNIFMQGVPIGSNDYCLSLVTVSLKDTFEGNF